MKIVGGATQRVLHGQKITVVLTVSKPGDGIYNDSLYIFAQEKKKPSIRREVRT